MGISVPSTLPLVYSTLLPIALVCLGDISAAQENGIVQPVPFSHRLHASRERIGCLVCHVETGSRGQHMSIAPLSTCVACHTRKRIAGLPKAAVRSGRVTWEPVWFLPEFIWFSHRTHARATGCATCHGPVEQRDVLWREVETNMKFCRSCHKQTGAKDVCGTCHALR